MHFPIRTLVDLDLKPFFGFLETAFIVNKVIADHVIITLYHTSPIVRWRLYYRNQCYWWKEQDSEPVLFVKGTDPRIRSIRISTKMSRIRNTEETRVVFYRSHRFRLQKIRGSFRLSFLVALCNSFRLCLCWLVGKGGVEPIPLKQKPDFLYFTDSCNTVFCWLMISKPCIKIL